jgi:hypothetical protein
MTTETACQLDRLTCVRQDSRRDGPGVIDNGLKLDGSHKIPIRS